jgi:2-polyprenyl-6-methoxyphenol hydroxylase-like FAD-dependent oxidoreductase
MWWEVSPAQHAAVRIGPFTAVLSLTGHGAPMHKNSVFRTLIVGGSVGGLAAAHELLAVGVDVAVYERSRGTMEARGARLVKQPEVETLLLRLGLTAESVSVELMERQQLHLHATPTRYEAPQLMTAWDTVYRTLREPLAEVCYQLDSTLRRVQVEGDNVTAEFGDGYTARGNFLVGADGIGSATRRLLDPTARPTYAGYIALRGLEHESDLPEELVDLLTDRFTFFGASGMQMLCSLVPGREGETAKGSRRVNWVWYVNTGEHNLSQLLTGVSGRRFENFLPPGEVTSEVTEAVMAAAAEFLPKPLGQLVELSGLFMQPVFDLRPFRMVADHATLIGDAAGTVRPHTASGTSKAFEMAQRSR